MIPSVDDFKNELGTLFEGDERHDPYVTRRLPSIEDDVCAMLSLPPEEAMLRIQKIQAFFRRGTGGRWEGVPESIFLERPIKAPLGRVATVPLGGRNGDRIGPVQHAADASFIVEIRNNFPWIFEAVAFALANGFEPGVAD